MRRTVASGGRRMAVHPRLFSARSRISAEINAFKSRVPFSGLTCWNRAAFVPVMVRAATLPIRRWWRWHLSFGVPA
jgi:hypothetical protein